MIHPDERTMQEEYEYQCLLRYYGETPLPEPVPDRTEAEWAELEARA